MKVTDKTLDLLAEKKIYTSNNRISRLKIGDEIIVDTNAKIEPFTCFGAGGILGDGSVFVFLVIAESGCESRKIF